MPAAQDIVDASEHYHGGEQTHDVIPSLLTVIIDTNPRAWSALNGVISLTQAISNILIYINTHLAFDNANEVAVLAAHSHRAVWLYPTPTQTLSTTKSHGTVNSSSTGAPQPVYSANKFPEFAQIEASVLDSLRNLLTETTHADIASTTTTQISGALTLALSNINKTSISLTSTGGGSTAGPGSKAATGGLPGLNARILIVSVSDSSPAQYIPTMNTVFAAAYAQITIDTLSLRGNPTFLQQASYLTGGAFIRAKDPQGMMQLLMFGFARNPPSHIFNPDDGEGPLASAKTEQKRGGNFTSTGHGDNPLVIPSTEVVDFRAACFCHRNVVDTGYVCSVCLSIFCEVPEGGECLTCGTKLQLGNYGAKPVVA